MDLDRLAALTLASVVLIAVPGPSVLFVVGRSLAHGRRVALLSVAGNSLGALAAAVVVAVGLGPVLERSEQLLVAVKIAGALYLVWLGLAALRTRAVPGPADRARDDPGRAVRQGVVVGLSNPKIILFFSAFLPQFVEPGGPPVPVQLLLLALVPVTVGLVLDSAWGLAAGAARSWVATDPRRLVWTTRGGGALMVGLGGGLAVETVR